MAFVSLDNDFCIYHTDNSQIGGCLGFSGQVYSGTMSADAKRYAIILLNEEGRPENKILLIDLDNDSSQKIELKAPLLDGDAVEVLQADVMDFSSDGTLLMYDAFTQFQSENGSKVGVWNIYGLDLKTGVISFITRPSLERDTGNASFSQTRDSIIAYEEMSHDSFGSIIIATKNLLNGTSYKVKAVNSSFNMVTPAFTGDDSAIIYSVPDSDQLSNSTGFSLLHQPLADGSISAEGDSSLWLKNASQGAIYRRGTFKQREKFHLNVSLIGKGDGLVLSSPSGIICGNDCSEEYIQNTKISLVANATSENSIFLGWGGECSGTDTCLITVNDNKSVTANFSLKVTPSSSNNVFGNARLFVKQQYRDFFHREGDIDGIEYWRKAIDEGYLSRAEVVISFLDSNEFSGRVAPIVRLYLAYFKRIPDFQGLNYWLDKFRNGKSLSSISKAFIQSAEFRAVYGDISDEDFVTLVYQNVLNRNPDNNGFKHWVNKLKNGKSRSEVMLGFSESEEFRIDTRGVVGLIMLYSGMLQRSPSIDGLNFWINWVVSNNGSGLDIINGFLDSLEYRNRF